MFIYGVIDEWTNAAPRVQSSTLNSAPMIEFLLLYNEVLTPCLVLLAYVSQVVCVCVCVCVCAVIVRVLS